MKYISNKIVCGALSMLALLGTTSCSEDFLKEDVQPLLLKEYSKTVMFLVTLPGKVLFYLLRAFWLKEAL